MKRVLITGGMGALGRAVIKQIQQVKKYQIFITSSRMDISDHSDDITVCVCHFLKLDQLTAAFHAAKPDLILHLGAVFTNDFPEAYNMNVAPAYHLLNLVHQEKLNTRVILIGSAAEYGVVRPEENPVNEQHSLFPVSAYGVSKAWQTQLMGLYAHREVDIICARIFNLFGPGISEKLFAGRIQLQMHAVKQGKQSAINVGRLTAIRDYISTDDAARQLLTIAAQGRSGHIYHIGSGQPITMRDFLMQQLELNGLSSTLIHEASEHSNHSGYDIPVMFANMEKTLNLTSKTQSINWIKSTV